jgi:hypothetical protein
MPYQWQLIGRTIGESFIRSRHTPAINPTCSRMASHRVVPVPKFALPGGWAFFFARERSS